MMIFLNDCDPIFNSFYLNQVERKQVVRSQGFKFHPPPIVLQFCIIWINFNTSSLHLIKTQSRQIWEKLQTADSCIADNSLKSVDILSNKQLISNFLVKFWICHQNLNIDLKEKPNLIYIIYVFLL